MADRSPDAAFLIIGNEILSGRTQDANLRTLAKALRARGRRIAEVRVVRDELDAVAAAVNELRARHFLLFTSGGIGPTHDDITTACVAAAFGVPVVRDAEAERTLTDFYVSIGREANPGRLSMADIPQGAETVYCEMTAAPGYRIENVCVFAGVPYIFESMLDEVIGSIEPRPEIVSRTVTVEVGESEVAADLSGVQERHPDLEVGSYPQDDHGRHYAELVISGDDPEAIGKAVAELQEALDRRGVEWRE